MPWVKGKSGNPGGRSRTATFHLERLRKNHTEEFIDKLKACAANGESWALMLGLHYCLGKPTDVKFDITMVSDEELDAEVRRRYEVVRAADALGEAPPATEPH